MKHAKPMKRALSVLLALVLILSLLLAGAALLNLAVYVRGVLG